VLKLKNYSGVKRLNPFTPAGSEHYTGTETRSLLHEEAGNRLTEKLTRQDATDPK